MNTKSFLIIAVLCRLTDFGLAQDIDSAPPVVVKTVPEAGSKDVAPGEMEIKAVFSKEMADQSWSWCTAWDKSMPEMIGKPHYEADHKTCVLKVKLEPGKTYGIWLNTQKFTSFQDPQHRHAVPYLLTFQTAEASAVAASAGTVSSDPKSAVHNWLELMDTGAFGQSWETAANSFHNEITKDDWIAKMENVRTPLGRLVSRKEIFTQSTPAVMGMPPGFYYTAQFETSFAGLTNAVETVEFVQEKDGQWRAIYYLIRPRTAEQTAAVAAAQKWLAEIDAGNYAQSWTDAAEFFQGAITQDKWVAAMESLRKPLGKLVIRAVNTTVTQTQMPGAPDGKYVVMQFAAAFSEKNSATETVTFVQEKDGIWKADGYYIK